MNQTRLTTLTIADAVSSIKNGEFSALELVEAVLDRIEKIDWKLNCYITVTREEAAKEAKKVDKYISTGKHFGPLQGVPIAIKDIMATKGIRTTMGSKIYSHYVPEYDATVVKSLKSAGAILMGKLNLHELASGGTTENPHFGATRNPWDVNRIPGGSSGGSAAAVSASLCLGSLGTDTSGSIRLPASFCGVVGLKPTYGRVSRNGVLTLSWTLDHVGPITRTVKDAAIILQAIAGYDPKDSATSSRPVPNYPAQLSTDLTGLRIAVIKEFSSSEVLDNDVTCVT